MPAVAPPAPPPPQVTPQQTDLAQLQRDGRYQQPKETTFQRVLAAVDRIDLAIAGVAHEAGARRERIDFLGRAGGGRKQSGKCDAAEARAEAVEEIAPGRSVEGAGAGAGEIGISRHTRIRWR